MDLWSSAVALPCGGMSTGVVVPTADGSPLWAHGGNGFEGRAPVVGVDLGGIAQVSEEDCSAIWEISESPDDESAGLGSSVDIADLDRDGLPEVVVGHPQRISFEDPLEGGVFVFSTPLDGAITLDEADRVWEGNHNSAGSWLAILSTQTETTVLVAAPEEYADGEGTGRLYLVDGEAPEGGLDERSHGHVIGPGGYGVSGQLGTRSDLTGDGIPDVVTGDEYSAGYSGITIVIESPMSGVIQAVDSQAAFLGEPASNSGRARSTGDSDGDGHDDLLIGAPFANEYEGAAYLFCGPLEGDLTWEQADALFRPRERGPEYFNQASLGEGLSLDQDLDGDGRQDVAVGMSRFQVDEVQVGAAYVWFGPVWGQQDTNHADVEVSVPPDDVGAVGRHILGVPDLDGDGRDEVLIYGAYLPGEDTVATFLLWGGAL